MQGRSEIGHTSVVKKAALLDPEPDGGTRGRVTELLLCHGPATASELGAALGLSPAAIRRHLDAMLAEKTVHCRQRPHRTGRGRGRPAKVFELTDAGRSRFRHAYDDLAAAALRWIETVGGPGAVASFAAQRVAALEDRCETAMAEAGADPIA
ncbi:MAG: ArsR family transcriptional regulator, partial [Dactylosporangium sp.]|nr:ArsR family transcriptional regulator [Dactylosporangium sp.]NNJ63360.1 ArsR family transcriptional regulator [Dactylosporangium sp.]